MARTAEDGRRSARREVGVAASGAAIITVIGSPQVADIGDVRDSTITVVLYDAANRTRANEDVTTRGFQEIALARDTVVAAFPPAADGRADDRRCARDALDRWPARASPWHALMAGAALL